MCVFLCISYNFAWQSFAICAQLVLMCDMKSINKLRCPAGASSTSAALS